MADQSITGESALWGKRDLDQDQYVANYRFTGIGATVGVNSLPTLLAPDF